MSAHRHHALVASFAALGAISACGARTFLGVGGPDASDDTGIDGPMGFESGTDGTFDSPTFDGGSDGGFDGGFDGSDAFFEGGFDGSDGTFESGFTDAASCSPGSLAGFAPGLNPSAAKAGMCTTTEISSIVADCFGGDPDASANACTTLITSAAIKTCYTGCVTTNWTASSGGTSYVPTPWGGIVDLLNPGPTSFIDLGGCLLAASPGNAVVQKCATAYEELQECELEACASGCPIPNPPPGKVCSSDPACAAAESALDVCLNAATSGVCKTYEKAVSTDCAAVDTDSGLLAVCSNAVNVIEGGGSGAAVAKAFNQYLDIICTGGLGGGG